MNGFEKRNRRGKLQNNRIKQLIIFTVMALTVITTISVLLAVDCSADKHPHEKIYTPKEPTGNLPDRNLILVNSQNPIPEDFTVELTQLKNGQAIDKRAYDDLQAMMDAARSEGLSPLICSSYRTNEKQQALYSNEVKQNLVKGYSQEDAEAEAAKWVSVPGTSEHQTGLAVDIVDVSYQLLDERQERTPVQKWLMQNAHRYGFILRYPNDKSSITGINYEPWHYRYVGKDAAEEMYEKRICLEEYLETLD